MSLWKGRDDIPIHEEVIQVPLRFKPRGAYIEAKRFSIGDF